MTNGWIKLHRRLTGKGYYKRSQYVHLWIHLLLNANHKKQEFMFNKEIIIIKEGQLLTGRKQLSKATGINSGTIENILKMLENEHQILQQKTTKFRVITIVNWHSYQVSDSDIDNKVTTELQQSYTNKNDKNVKNDKKFIPPSLSEVKEYFQQRGYLESIAVTAFDYYDSARWKDSRGKPVKNWKQKMIAVWMKEEHKITEKTDVTKSIYKKL